MGLFPKLNIVPEITSFNQLAKQKYLKRYLNSFGRFKFVRILNFQKYLLILINSLIIINGNCYLEFLFEKMLKSVWELDKKYKQWLCVFTKANSY